MEMEALNPEEVLSVSKLLKIKEDIILDIFDNHVKENVYMSEEEDDKGRSNEVGIMTTNFFDDDKNLLFSCALVRESSEVNYVIGATMEELKPRDIPRLKDFMPKIRGKKRALDKNEFVFYAKNVEQAQMIAYERVTELIDIVIDNDYKPVAAPSEALKPKRYYEELRTEALKTSVRQNSNFAKMAKQLFEWNQANRAGKVMTHKYVLQWASETGQRMMEVEKSEPMLICLCNEFKKEKTWNDVRMSSELMMSLFPDVPQVFDEKKEENKKHKKVKVAVSRPQAKKEQLTLF